MELAELRARGGQAIVTEVRLRRGADAAPPDVGLPTSWYLPGKGSRFAELRRLLRRSALGDVRLRDVAVPSVCPELLVNLGDATAKDLALVHRSVVERVHQVTGLELGDRMRWVGRPS
ncbi:MAG TPA: hypothetical protein PKA64_24285 [Myxococcota bacterium]|nr:hypothetical protein [Myxococcota bacterium]